MTAAMLQERAGSGLFGRLAGLIAFALAAAGALGALVAQGGRFSDRLDVAAHFAPLFLWSALAGAGLMLLAPKGPLRNATRWLAAAGAPLALMLIAPELARPEARAAPAAPAQLTLVQFNIWGGRNRDLEASLDWVWAQQADVVVLQEATPRVRRLIARNGDYHLSCERRACQTLILTKAAPLAAGLPAVRAGRPFSSAAAVAQDELGPIPIVGVHYTHPTRGARQQAQGVRLAAILKRYPKERLILAGDFNSAPWSFTRRREDAAFGIERRTKALASWPTVASRRRVPLPFPLLPIDHVYAGPAWRTVSVERGPRLGSDHYPIVVKLAPAPPRGPNPA